MRMGLNKKYDEIMSKEDYTRRKNYRLMLSSDINKKEYLWIKRGDTRGCTIGSGISWDNLVFDNENLYLNIPFPLKQQT